MKLLNSLLLCLMVHGICSYKYYYKKIGNGFDIIYADHEFGGYKELKSPKSLKVDHYNRGERPGVCNYGQFFCSFPYQRSATQHFECTLDYQCPRFFKCCQPLCFVHRVCQPALGIEASSTLSPQPSITTDIWKTSTSIFSPDTLTTHLEENSTEETKSTTTNVTTSEPPEPEPQVLNVETSAELSSRGLFGTKQTDTGEISISTQMREQVSTEISTIELFEVESPVNLEISTSTETKTQITTVISTEETFKLESPANLETRTSSKTSEITIHELSELEVSEDLDIDSPSSNITVSTTTEISLETKGWVSTEHTSERGTLLEKTEQITIEITTNTPPEIKSSEHFKTSSSSETKKQTTTGVDPNELREQIPTTKSVNNTFSESRKYMTERHEGSTIQLTMTTELTNISFGSEVPDLFNNSAVESTDITNTSNTSFLDTEISFEISIPITTRLPLVYSGTPTDINVNSSSLKRNNSNIPEQVSDFGESINKTSGINQKKDDLETAEVDEVTSEDYLMATKGTSHKPQVTETSLELKNTSTGYIPEEKDSDLNDTISESDKKEHVTEIDQSSRVNFEERRKSTISHTGQYERFDEDDEDLASYSGSGDSSDDDGRDNGSGEGSGDGSSIGVEYSTNLFSNSEPKSTSGIRSSSGTKGWVTTEPSSEEPANETEREISTEKFEKITTELTSNTHSGIETPKNTINKTSSINQKKDDIEIAEVDEVTSMSTKGTSHKPQDTETSFDLKNTSTGSGEGSGDGTSNGMEYSTNSLSDSQPKSISDIKSSPGTKEWVITEHKSKEPVNETERETLTEKITTEITTNTPSEIESPKSEKSNSSSDATKQTTARIDRNESRERKLTYISVNDTYSESRKNITTDSIDISERYSTDKYQSHRGSTIQLTMTTESSNTSFESRVSSLSNVSAVKSTDITNETSDKPLVTITTFELEDKSTGYIPKDKASESNYDVYGSDKKQVAEKSHPTEVKFDDRRKFNISHTGQDDHFNESNVKEFSGEDSGSVNKSDKHTQLSTEPNNFRKTPPYPLDDEDLTTLSGSGDVSDDDDDDDDDDDYDDGSDDGNGNGSGDGSGNIVEFSTNVHSDSENSNQKFSESVKNEPLSPGENKYRGTSPHAIDNEFSSSFSGSADFYSDGDGNGLESSTNVPSDSETKSISE